MTSGLRSHSIRKKPPMELLGRAGYTAKGVVYSIIGILAVQAAWVGGSSGETTGAQGAIQTIAEQPFGQILLVFTAIGLLCYGVWRLIYAITDSDGNGDDAEGIAKRAGYAASGIIYLALSYFAVKLALGSGGGSSQSALTETLMSTSFGLVVLGIIGAVLIIVGLKHFKRAYDCSFMRKYRGEMSARQREWAQHIGRWGISARGLAFIMVGIFFIQAALAANPDQAQGLGAVFETLLRQPYGPWLLGIVAIGFVCYGVYCFSYARYRRFER